MFTNLVINAFEALGGTGQRARLPRGPARWKTRRPGTRATDRATSRRWWSRSPTTGPGIPAELKDRVFNAFFTTKAQGSGLGLAIVRKIIDAHDGRIDVASRAGQGTRFTVTLPVSAASDEWFQ